MNGVKTTSCWENGDVLFHTIAKGQQPACYSIAPLNPGIGTLQDSLYIFKWLENLENTVFRDIKISSP